MTTKAQVSALTTEGGTTKTLIDTVTVPQGVRRIIGIWAYIAVLGMTTLEPISGIIEFESDDMNIIPLQLPLDARDCVTSGMAAWSPHIIPVDVPINGTPKIKGSVTLDAATTIANKARFGFIYEV